VGFPLLFRGPRAVPDTLDGEKRYLACILLADDNVQWYIHVARALLPRLQIAHHYDFFLFRWFSFCTFKIVYIIKVRKSCELDKLKWSQNFKWREYATRGLHKQVILLLHAQHRKADVISLGIFGISLIFLCTTMSRSSLEYRKKWNICVKMNRIVCRSGHVSSPLLDVRQYYLQSYPTSLRQVYHYVE
jgi:hypothetical protein